MDNTYILGPNGELYHWGIKGMKWGVRRYQNKDGSLTPRGKKRYAEETAKLKEREKTIKARERTNAKLTKLSDKKAELDAREKALLDGKTAPKKDDASVPTKTKSESPKDMSDTDLQTRVNRLRNEDAYRDLSKKLGYDTPTTELDLKIAEMKKQKEYLELQRDIKNLTPKKVSKGKEFVNKVWEKALEPAILDAGKTIAKQYLTDLGLNEVSKLLGKEAKKMADQAAKTEAKQKAKEDKAAKNQAKEESKQAAKEAKQQAKAEAKQAAKEAKQQAREEAREKARQEREDRAKYTVEDNGGNTRKRDKSSDADSDSVIYDHDRVYRDSNGWYRYADSSVMDIVTSRNTSAGRNYVAGLLSAPKDDD